MTLHGRVVAAIAALAIAAAAVLMTFAASAHAAVTPPPYQQPVPITHWQGGTMAGVRWMIKANDYAEFPPMYGRWTWMMCGESVIYGMVAQHGVPPSTVPGPCSRNQVQTFGDYWSLAAAISAGRTGTRVVFDPEAVPAAEQANQARFIRLGCQLAAAHHIAVVVTPQGPAAQRPAMYAAGARYCTVVEIQSQGLEINPPIFRASVAAFLKIVRGIPRHAAPMVGLASDPGGRRVTQAALLSDYRWARSQGVTRFWMNAAAWTGEPYMDGTGDAQIAEAFFKTIGATP